MDVVRAETSGGGGGEKDRFYCVPKRVGGKKFGQAISCRVWSGTTTGGGGGGYETSSLLASQDA